MALELLWLLAMPRKRFLASKIWPYHVTARCINREWFNLPIEQVWNIFSMHLHFVHHAFGLRIHSFVLMNNHFHMIVSTPKENLAEVMNYFMREVSKNMARVSGRINQTFGGPYYWSLLQSPHYYLYAYKYVYRNPVEAGLIGKVEDYPYSTLFGLKGSTHLMIPVEHDDTLFNDPDRILTWLNNSYPIQAKEDIRNALGKKEFKFGLDKDRKPHILEAILV